jgi:hypothetical protein
MSSIYERRDNGDGSYSTNTALTDVDAILPIGIEYNRQKTVQTHTNLTVAPGAYSMGTYIDTDGFKEVDVMSNIDASVANQIDVHWSNDGTNMHYNEAGIGGTTASLTKQGLVPTKARWMKVNIKNGDAAAHVMSAWIYLKV